MKWHAKYFRNFANFTGRARRREFWSVIATIAAIQIIVCWLCLFAANDVTASKVVSIATTFLIIPLCSVTARRMHDIGMSSMWRLFLYFLVIGWIVLALIFAASSMQEPFDNAGTGHYDIIAFLLIMYAIFVVCGYLPFFLVWVFTKGDRGCNKYGVDPIAVSRNSK